MRPRGLDILLGHVLDGGGGVRLKVGFRPLTTDCKLDSVVHAGVGIIWGVIIFHNSNNNKQRTKISV